MDLFNHPHIFKDKQKDSFEVINPANGEILAYIKNTHKQDLQNLIQKAKIAQKHGQIC